MLNQINAEVFKQNRYFLYFQWSFINLKNNQFFGIFFRFFFIYTNFQDKALTLNFVLTFSLYAEYVIIECIVIIKNLSFRKNTLDPRNQNKQKNICLSVCPVRERNNFQSLRIERNVFNVKNLVLVMKFKVKF